MHIKMTEIGTDEWASMQAATTRVTSLSSSANSSSSFSLPSAPSSPTPSHFSTTNPTADDTPPSAGAGAGVGVRGGVEPEVYDNAMQQFYNNASALRVSTDVLLNAALRRQYRQQRITTVGSGFPPVRLLDYAAAAGSGGGRVVIVPAPDEDNPLAEPFEVCSYLPPARRLDGGAGTLYRNVKFGRYAVRYRPGRGTSGNGSNEDDANVDEEEEDDDKDQEEEREGEEFSMLLYVADCRDGTNNFPQLLTQYLVHAPDAGTTDAAEALVREAGAWANGLHDEIWVFDQGFWRKDADLWRSVAKASWRDVILDPAAKRDIRADVARFFAGRARYDRLRIAWKRGVIYHGPPGNGKTVSIKALMHQLYFDDDDDEEEEEEEEWEDDEENNGDEEDERDELATVMMKTAMTTNKTNKNKKNIKMKKRSSSQSKIRTTTTSTTTAAPKKEKKKKQKKQPRRKADFIPALYVRSLAAFGGPEAGIKQIFGKARAEAPCLLVFEDLDSIVTEQVRSYFLNEVDGLAVNEGVMLLGSTNHLDRLDPGLSKRPSRFDRKFLFPKPDFDGRRRYAEYWRHKLGDGGGGDDSDDDDDDDDDNDPIEFPPELSPAVARVTDGFSFAYIQEAFVATLLAIASREEEDDDGGDSLPFSGGYGYGNSGVKALASKKKDPLDRLVLWREFKKQVKVLRDEM